MVKNGRFSGRTSKYLNHKENIAYDSLECNLWTLLALQICCRKKRLLKEPGGEEMPRL